MFQTVKICEIEGVKPTIKEVGDKDKRRYVGTRSGFIFSSCPRDRQVVCVSDGGCLHVCSLLVKQLMSCPNFQPYWWAVEVHCYQYKMAVWIFISQPNMTEKGKVEALSKEVESIRFAADKYRSILHEELEADNILWRYGSPPIFDAVNKLFEEGRTKEWPKGSLEEAVQNAVKSWEMELSHKTRLQDFKTISHEKFKLIVNGREGLSAEETLRLGSYNTLLKNSLPQEFQYYKVDEESFESSHKAFKSAFPRGFAWEVISVYSGPPLITYKFRHWGYFEGHFKGHAPTGEMVQFFGIGVMKVDKSMRAEDVEIYYDPAELFGGLLRGPLISDPHKEHQDSSIASASSSQCPFSMS